MAKIKASDISNSGGQMATGSGNGTSVAELSVAVPSAIEAQALQAHGMNPFLSHIMIVKPHGAGSGSDIVNKGSCVPLGVD